MDELSFNGKLLHTDYAKPDAYNALSMPVYNSAAYEFESAEQMESAFTGKTPEFAYSRISNPTVQYFEDRVKTITGAYSVTALNSGMAAISNAIITLAHSGCNIVTSRHLFGNTYSFFTATMATFGVETRFCDLTSPDQVDAAIDKNTCAVFLEIITNPQMEVADLKKISAICTQKNVPLIADTTIIPFCAFNAKDFGINIEIVSSTKYISGGATSLGGLIMDYGNFNWMSSPKLHGMAKEFGEGAFTAKLRKEIHRNLGAYMTPQAAYMQTLGLETLTLRYEKATKTCFELVKSLKKIHGVASVNYNGLPENKYYELSKTQFGDRPGAMFTFDLTSREACFRFMNKLNIVKRATNLFDNKSLAIHPASTIFGNFTPEVRNTMHVSDKTIRISVGLEEMEDLLADFLQALSKGACPLVIN
ncbi:MAG: aminotransferase class I/II-fold pyridoxal phosphate-dependent enzyme [Paludibacter sp.]|nr:aminotransferase class I/II-fold pyridoxal phosphate-dependent enzyme [Paludibacter sp.]